MGFMVDDRFRSGGGFIGTGQEIRAWTVVSDGSIKGRRSQRRIHVHPER
jgi:hypothetical protein